MRDGFGRVVKNGSEKEREVIGSQRRRRRGQQLESDVDEGECGLLRATDLVIYIETYFEHE